MNIGTISTTITRKGQITIPIPIREAIGLRRGDKIAVSLRDGEVILRRGESVVLQTAGILKTNTPPLSAQELREAAEEAIADETLARMKG